MDEFSRYIGGEALYGEDFTPEEIKQWYADEQEGYANLGAKDSASYQYVYHAWNRFHAYRHLPDTRFSHVLGFGSAYGDELLPIISRIRDLTIVDPSSAFVRSDLHGIPVRYVTPMPDGRLPLPDRTFDLITCFGVLHHIPNVSFVTAELARTLKPGGYIALREPIISLGDWRRPRPGLTKRERGIPLHLLHKFLEDSGLVVCRWSLCGFTVLPRVFKLIRPDFYNSGLIAYVDALVSRTFSWNANYHPQSIFDRIRPTSAFFVARKPNNEV